MPDATHDTLRERLLEEVGKNDDFRIAYLEDASFYHGVNVAIRAAEEHERLLRERIMALRDEPHTTPPCRRAHTAEDAYDRVLAAFYA